MLVVTATAASATTSQPDALRDGQPSVCSASYQYTVLLPLLLRSPPQLRSASPGLLDQPNGTHWGQLAHCSKACYWRWNSHYTARCYTGPWKHQQLNICRSMFQLPVLHYNNNPQQKQKQQQQQQQKKTTRAPFAFRRACTRRRYIPGYTHTLTRTHTPNTNRLSHTHTHTQSSLQARTPILPAFQRLSRYPGDTQ